MVKENVAKLCVKTQESEEGVGAEFGVLAEQRPVVGFFATQFVVVDFDAGEAA
jgi:hypothetical protein